MGGRSHSCAGQRGIISCGAQLHRADRSGYLPRPFTSTRTTCACADTNAPDTHAHARSHCGMPVTSSGSPKVALVWERILGASRALLLQHRTTSLRVLAGTYRENLMIENAVRLEARDGPGTVTIFSELWVAPSDTHTRARAHTHTSHHPAAPSTASAPRPREYPRSHSSHSFGQSAAPARPLPAQRNPRSGRRWLVVLRGLLSGQTHQRRTVAAT